MKDQDIKEIIESAMDYAKTRTYPKGFYAGDGAYWVKCDSFEVASDTHFRYIIFVDGNESTIYKA